MNMMISEIPHEETAPHEEEGQTSLELSKDLMRELLRCEMLHALVSFRSTRFRAFVKRPASVLNDGWACEVVDGKARYILEGIRRTTQTLQLDRTRGRIKLTTVCPCLDKIHHAEYCTRSKSLLNSHIAPYKTPSEPAMN